MTDRELDALVAEKVMGWTRTGADDLVKPRHRPSKDWPGVTVDDWDDKGPHQRLEPPGTTLSDYHERSVFFCGCEGAELPNYSGSIWEAWLVVEEMTRRKWLVSIENQDEGFHDDGYQVSMRQEYGEWFSSPYKVGEPLTAPKAICLAALEALGVEVPHG